MRREQTVLERIVNESRALDLDAPSIESEEGTLNYLAIIASVTSLAKLEQFAILKELCVLEKQITGIKGTVQTKVASEFSSPASEKLNSDYKIKAKRYDVLKAQLTAARQTKAEALRHARRAEFAKARLELERVQTAEAKTAEAIASAQKKFEDTEKTINASRKQIDLSRAELRSLEADRDAKKPGIEQQKASLCRFIESETQIESYVKENVKQPTQEWLNKRLVMACHSILSDAEQTDITQKIEALINELAVLKYSPKKSDGKEFETKNAKALALEALLQNATSLEALQKFLDTYNYQDTAMQGTSSETAALFDKLCLKYHALVRPNAKPSFGNSNVGLFAQKDEPVNINQPRGFYNDNDHAWIVEYRKDLGKPTSKKPQEKLAKLIELQGLQNKEALQKFIEELRVADPNGILAGHPSRFKQLLHRLEFNYLLHPHPYFKVEELQTINQQIIIWRQEILTEKAATGPAALLKTHKIMALEALRKVDSDDALETFKSEHCKPDDPLLQGNHSQRGKTLVEEILWNHLGESLNLGMSSK
jgi:hypothetical protein